MLSSVILSVDNEVLDEFGVGDNSELILRKLKFFSSGGLGGCTGLGVSARDYGIFEQF